MPNTIQLKRSTTTGAVPTSGQLEQGELAVNLVDKKIFTKNASGDVVDLAVATVPPNVKVANYTLAKSDTGNHISISGGDITVPPSVFAPGDVVVIYNNNGSTSRSIIKGAGVTMYWINAVDANRTLGIRGVATLLCVASNTFVITGQGVS
jgi:hypothetical protein